MPADRPTHQSSLNPSFPFDRRASSLSASSSSSSSPSLHPSAAPSPSSTLESDYPDTPPSFTTRIPAHGFPSQQQQQQQHQFPRPRTNSSFFPPTPQQQQHHHQQHRQTGSAAGRVGGDGFPRPRELSVGYDPGGGRGERMVEVFEGGGGGAGHFSTSSAFSPQDLVIYGPSVEYGFKSPLPLPLPLPLSSSSRAPATALVQPYFHSPVSPAPPFYPNYQGPPVFESPQRPTQDEIQMWETESEGGRPPAPERTLQMPPPVVYRSTATTDCKRCRSHAVDCEWPGDEGVGACSNCFFSYSLCEEYTPPDPKQPSENNGFSLSAIAEQEPHDGERTPTQSPRPGLGSHSSSNSSSSSFPGFELPSSSTNPVRPSPQIPISFLLTGPSSASASRSSSSQPTRRWSASPSSSSAPSSKTKHSELVEGEMTELFGRVVQLQADANSSLGQVVEKLRSPPLAGSKLPEEKELPQEGRQETEVDRPESGGSGTSRSMEGVVGPGSGR